MGRSWLWNLQENLLASFWQRNPPPALWQSQQYFQWSIFSDMKQIHTVTLTVLVSIILLLPNHSKFILNFFQDIQLLYQNTAYNTISDVFEEHIILYRWHFWEDHGSHFFSFCKISLHYQGTSISFVSSLSLIENNFPPKFSYH